MRDGQRSFLIIICLSRNVYIFRYETCEIQFSEELPKVRPWMCTRRRVAHICVICSGPTLSTERTKLNWHFRRSPGFCAYQWASCVRVQVVPNRERLHYYDESQRNTGFSNKTPNERWRACNIDTMPLLLLHIQCTVMAIEQRQETIKYTITVIVG